MSNQNSKAKKPLEGLKIIEMGQLLAGPFASVMLAWFGAEVIKIEPPGVGDPLRSWRAMYKGTALWWYILGRNKKCITVNLREARGQEIVRKLVADADVVLENFKPGTMEKWGLGYEELKRINPRLIMARVSGWGQTGPNASKPGFASVAEGVGGLRFVNGYPDRPPVRLNLSLGDTLAGLHAAIGILMAVYHRDVHGSGKGQLLDVAIYEAVFNVMEGIVPEYDKNGVIREREGTRLSGIVPTGTYPCKDGKFIIIGGNSDSIFKRMMTAMGQPDMAADTRFAHNNDRVEHVDEIEDAIIEWTKQRTHDEVLEVLEGVGVPVGPIYSVADMMNDPHFQARGMFEKVSIGEGDTVTLPTMVPKLSDTPGGTEWPGPPLGSHNQEILGDHLGLSDSDLEKLKADGII